MSREHAESLIVEIPDYPNPGVLFKDLTPVFSDPAAMAYVLDVCAKYFVDKKVTKIAGIEARGFMVGAALASHMGVGFVPIRKKGKLPRETYRVEYSLEYGQDAIEIHRDALTTQDHVLLVDDVLATGGTACAAGQLVEQCGATLSGFAVLLNLDFLGGDKKFAETFPDTEVFTVFG